MNKLFQQANTPWVKYSEYEYRQAEDGKLYLTPTSEAKPKPYNPLQNFEEMVIAALNVGILALKHQDDSRLRNAIKDFVIHYGLLGFIAALPTTANFTDYAAVYLPKNHFIKAETLPTNDYLAYFFPFEKLDTFNNEGKFIWHNTDRTMIALSLTMQEFFVVRPALGRTYIHLLPLWNFITNKLPAFCNLGAYYKYPLQYTAHPCNQRKGGFLIPVLHHM